MTRSTKEQARQAVEVYGTLLKERAVISDIEQEDERGVIRYSFQLLDRRFPYMVDCEGIKELALVLTSMWSAYDKAIYELGF